MTERYATVAVLSGSPQRGAFTYAIPEDLSLRRGMSVVVPWRAQWALGIILEVSATSDVGQPRPIERLLDPVPLLTHQQLELAAWLASRYVAPISACVALFLPPGTPTRARSSPTKFQSILPSPPAAVRRLLPAQTGKQLRAIIDRWPGSKNSRPARLLELLSNGDLSVSEAKRVIGGRKELDDWLSRTAMVVRENDTLRLAISPEEAKSAAVALRRTASERRQLALLRLLEEGELEESAAKRQSGARRADIDALERRGLVRRVVDSQQSAVPPPVAAPSLTDEQSASVDEIVAALEEPAGRVFLLHGVTGSGKTEVYLAASERALANGGSVIVLIPEIALAPQTIERFEARFPGAVAVRHSGLSHREAREQWRQLQSGRKRILIGARSAMFGPAPNLQLVVVDEEHEWTYKQQDPQPRYHATAVAREMARSWNVVTVLGSATPDLVSMARARAGADQLLRLTQRLQSAAAVTIAIPQPVVDIVDMRQEMAEGVRSVFSRELDAAISDALRRGEQALLFLNRRGMSALVCRACGEAVECERCSITMTLHRRGPILQCHECGARQPTPSRCPACADQRLGAMSFGTAQLEAEVRRRWGDIPITRWDRDTTKASGSHEALLQEFAAGRSQVLIGTQMIAKGLDLPNVTVAGVVNADLSLRESDYRAAERTWQLLSQVAGRAGRGGLGGRVIVQTYSPDHFAVTAAALHDADAFYEQEMRIRAALDYPPFGRLARLTVARTTMLEADAEAQRVVRELTELRDRTLGGVAEVIGPAPANPARRRNQWRRQVLLKGDEPARLLAHLELGRGWSIDIDPVG